MSGATRTDAAGIVEDVSDRKLLTKPFLRMAYADAMEKYGSDKPDLRYDLEWQDVTELAGQSDFGVFKNNVAAGLAVKVMRVPQLGAGSGSQLKKLHGELEELAKAEGMKGLAWMALPTIVSISEDALQNVGRDLREGSYALGDTRAETMLKVVIPAAMSGICAAIIPGVMRAIGETMVVWMASG